MKDNLSVSPVPSPLPPLLSSQQGEVPWGVWMRRLLACNPFYLVSAACLLYGLYRLTIDPAFRSADVSQLGTIFGSLQLYELLLVITAIFLAKRMIWYDSTLLVSLENMLVLVPFILVTVAAYIGDSAAWIVCGIGAVLAGLKFWGLKRFIAPLNLPVRLLMIGATVLVINLTVPFFFRSVRNGGQDGLSEYSLMGWLLVLPVLAASVNLLHRPTQWGGVAAQRSWLPLLMAAIWVTVTAVHLYCLGYIYDLRWQLGLIAPVLWAASWTSFHRLTDFAEKPSKELENAVLSLPIGVALLGAWGGISSITLALATLNATLYIVIWGQNRTNRFVRDLMIVSAATMMAAIPEFVGQALIPDYKRSICVMGAIACFVIVRACMSRGPVLGLAGAGAVAMTVAGLFGPSPHVTDFAIQAGLVFLLLHSLSWNEEDHSYARPLRIWAAVAWMIHATLWTWSDGGTASWTVTAMAALVLGGYFVAGLLWHHWVSWILPVIGTAVMLLVPLKKVVIVAKAAPTGLLAVLLGFLLFGVGTAIALNRSRIESRP